MTFAQKVIKWPRSKKSIISTSFVGIILTLFQEMQSPHVVSADWGRNLEKSTKVSRVETTSDGDAGGNACLITKDAPRLKLSRRKIGHLRGKSPRRPIHSHLPTAHFRAVGSRYCSA